MSRDKLKKKKHKNALVFMLTTHTFIECLQPAAISGAI